MTPNCLRTSMTAQTDHGLLSAMTPTEDARLDRQQYVSAELADLIDRQVRGEHFAWPDFLDLTEVRPAGEAGAPTA